MKNVLLRSALDGQHDPGGSDLLRPYLKQVMSSIGLEDVSFTITAAGLNMGEEPRAAGIEAARAQIAEELSGKHVEAPGRDELTNSGESMNNEEKAA